MFLYFLCLGLSLLLCRCDSFLGTRVSSVVRRAVVSTRLQSSKRLNADPQALFDWISCEDGGFVADSIVLDTKSRRKEWTLQSTATCRPGSDLLRVPKRLCLSADPNLHSHGGSYAQLTDNTRLLMSAMSSDHWRARLAVALLSERARPDSHFASFLGNLPYEFGGIPMYFPKSEFHFIQDAEMMRSTRDRSLFLREFTAKVLAPLHDSERDPFDGNLVDASSFAWGFAIASSRALRNRAYIGEGAVPVLIPGIDMASHSCAPNCEVTSEGDCFVLRTLSDVSANDELTISYGSMSNDEYFSDYGFTVDGNSLDTVTTYCTPKVINNARMVMRQSSYLGNTPFAVSDPKGNAVLKVHYSTPQNGSFLLGMGGDSFDFRWLHKWQLCWLETIGVSAYADRDIFSEQFKMKIGGPELSKIDGRLWALLRILYSSSEEELLRNGYTPELLKSSGSLLTCATEAQVIKTLMGIVALSLKDFGTDLDVDLVALRLSYLSNVHQEHPPLYSSSDRSDIIREEILQLLSTVVDVPKRTFAPGVTRQSLVSKNFKKSFSMRSPVDGSEGRVSPSYAIASLSSQGDAQAIFEDQESKEKLVDVASTSGWISFQDVTVDINACGESFPVNVRESVRYRIRKKKLLVDLLKNLVQAYELLRAQAPSDVTTLEEIINSEDDSAFAANQMTRSVRIRDLIQGNPSKSLDPLAIASSILAKYGGGDARL